MPFVYQRNSQGAKARPTKTSPVASCGPDIIATNAATKTIQTVMPIPTPPTIPTPRLASMVGEQEGVFVCGWLLDALAVKIDSKRFPAFTASYIYIFLNVPDLIVIPLVSRTRRSNAEDDG